MAISADNNAPERCDISSSVQMAEITRCSSGNKMHADEFPLKDDSLTTGGGGGLQLLRDDMSHAESVSRRKYATASLGGRSGPVVTRSADGVISIEMDAMSEDSGFYVRWNKLSYTVSPGWRERYFMGRTEKRILNGLDGYFMSGELVALMGPSGAGKTTLLECLCLKNKHGVSGDLLVVGKPKVRIAVVPQYDDFLPQFTVTETIFYASRYKNRTYDISHRGIVRRVIQQLGLEVCQNNSIMRCSGGQRKRVAIAQELVKKPNILILDEPTSGLDSSSCYQTMNVLRQIIDLASVSMPMSIVITIHQPSAKVMSLFDRVYLIAPGGRLAFNGSPQEMVPVLEQVGAPCPAFYNPIDHAIELVSGDFGQDKLERMVEQEASKRLEFDRKLESISAQPLRKAVLFDPCPFDDHMWIHVQRCTLQMVRDPILFSLRVGMHFIMAFFFAYLWGLDVGKGTACPTFNRQSLSQIAVALAANQTKEEQADTNRVNDNLVFSVYGGMFTMYAACMITVLSFPLDVKVLTKEYFNGWYTVTTYLCGKVTSDLPCQVGCVLMFATISYWMSAQPRSDYHWRFCVYAYSLVCLSLLAQTQGLIVGTIFMNNLSASVFVGPLTITPVFMFSGYSRRYSRTADYIKPIIKMSYFHHAIRTIYSALYGFGRCKCNPADYGFATDEVDYEDIGHIVHTNARDLAVAAHEPPLLPSSPPSSSSSDDASSGGGLMSGGLLGMSRPTMQPQVRELLDASKQIYIGQYRCDDSFRSLVMKELDIEDTDMYVGIVVLTSYLLFLRAIVLILLRYKVKR